MAARKEKEPPPPELLARLSEELARDGLPRILVVRGDERFFRERALSLALQAAAKADLELARHDGGDPGFDVRVLCDDLSAPPMFATARCVFVRNAASIGKRTEIASDAFVRAATAFVGDAARAGAIVVDGEGLRADHALVKLATRAGGSVLSFRRLYSDPTSWEPDPRRTELARWIVAEARERGARIDSDDAARLVAAVGNDLLRIVESIERVIHGGGRPLSEIVGWSSGGSPFELAEDLCRGDLVRSLTQIEALFRAGFQNQSGAREVEREAVLNVLFAMLRAKLRQSIAAAELVSRGATPQAAADALAIKWPKARDEFEARLACRPAREWAPMLEELAVLERAARMNTQVDANDVARLAVRWRRASVRAAPAPRR